MNAAVPAPPQPRLAVALTSLTALAYEILLMRLFSIGQWHHFAYMIVSLALLGYGASGTVLSLTRPAWSRRFPTLFTASVALFGVSALVCYALAERLPFEAEQILWDPRQWLYLLGIYLLLAVPFFFAASAVAMALSHYRTAVGRIYAADLLGAGAGSLAAVALLFALFPGSAVRVLASLAMATAAVAWLELRLRPRGAAVLLLALASLPLWAPQAWTTPRMSPYKELPQLLRIPGTEVVARRSSPLGLLSVVRSEQVPLRHAPGLSLMAKAGPPPQLGLFTDGEGMSAITRYTGDRQQLAYLDQMTSALPYHLGRPQRVLVLGAGGGAEILQALYHQAGRIDAVELNPQVAALVRDRFGTYAGGIYRNPHVHLHVAEARGFVNGSGQRYDLIQVALLDSFAASSAGLYALSESYLYTVQALQTYLEHLDDDGVLAITRWVKLPPRDSLKLFATSIDALRGLGLHDPGRHLVLIRSWQTATLLVRKNGFDAEDIARLRRFCDERAFDLAWYPGMPASAANRYNRLRRPEFHDGARALLGPGRGAYLSRYKFDLAPATDDRPYFFHFFKWSALEEMLALRGRGGTGLLELGYLVLLATLAQALVSSALLILLPLAWLRRRPRAPARGAGTARVFTYFTAIGLAFLFLEMAMIQRFILFLHHPVYAAAAVLAAFLVFAGLGSAWSQRLRRPPRTGVWLAAAGIGLLGLAYLALLGPLFAALGALPVAAKFVAAMLVVAPLAFCMGLPFPLALSAVAEAAPGLVPWAWGVNGCASVISAVLATLLAIQFGFHTVVVLAVLLYLAAALSFPGPRNRPCSDVT